MRIAWLLCALLLSVAVATLNLLAFEYFLYWRYEWYDVMMHFLGGVAIGAFLVGFLHRFRPRAYVVLFAFVIIGWEVFEYSLGFPRESNYAFDTALDLLMGTIGAVMAYVVARKTLWQA